MRITVLFLLSLVSAARVHAQTDSFPASLAGFSRVSLDGELRFEPGPAHVLSTSGSVTRFFGEHLQLGLSPSFTVLTGLGPNIYQARIAGAANVVVGRNRWRGYMGANVGGATASRQIGQTIYGAQAGVLYFLAPSAALRAEVRSHQSSYPGSIASAEAFLTIDPYLSGTPVLSEPAPSLGAIDLYAVAYTSFVADRPRELYLIVAPFIAPWAQIGTECQLFTFDWMGARHGASLVNGFVRLYAPHRWGVVPFVHGFAESSTFADGNPDGGLTSFGGMAGIRHYFNPGAALDVGVEERRYVEQGVSAASGTGYRQPNELALRARIVTQLHLR
jgi:hypothetical protein